MTPTSKGAVIERPAPAQSDKPAKSRPTDEPVSRAASKPEGAPDETDRQGSTQAVLDQVVGEGVALHEKLIVSPCPGRFQAGPRRDKASGEYVLAGQEIGRVISSDRETVCVKAAFSGWIMGYLVPEGSPVRVAEPVAWLRPH